MSMLTQSLQESQAAIAELESRLSSKDVRIEELES